MARTLADMTPEERQQCRGMWCDVQMMGGGTAQFIFSKLRPGPRMGAYLTEPGVCTPWTAEYEAITPRFDLMRAWNPDGTPPKGEWVEGHMWWGEDTDTMEPVDLVGAECLATGQIQGFDEWPDSVIPGEDVPVRRFITEWEATNG